MEVHRGFDGGASITTNSKVLLNWIQCVLGLQDRLRDTSSDGLIPPAANVHNMISSEEHATSFPSYFRMFRVGFNGNPIITTVTWFPEIIRSWIQGILHLRSRSHDRVVVGLGLQSPDCDDPYAVTVQLCVDGSCLIFQLRRGLSIPRSLVYFLTCPDIVFVGIQNGHHSGILMSFDPALIVPTLDLCLWAGMETASVEEMARHHLDIPYYVHSLGPVARSNWSTANLTEEQVQYACIDAYISLQIGLELEAWEWQSVLFLGQPVLDS